MFWAQYGHISGIDTFLDMLWTHLGSLRPKCVYPLIVLERLHVHVHVQTQSEQASPKVQSHPTYLSSVYFRWIDPLGIFLPYQTLRLPLKATIDRQKWKEPERQVSEEEVKQRVIGGKCEWRLRLTHSLTDEQTAARSTFRHQPTAAS